MTTYCTQRKTNNNRTKRSMTTYCTQSWPHSKKYDKARWYTKRDTFSVNILSYTVNTMRLSLKSTYQLREKSREEVHSRPSSWRERERAWCRSSASGPVLARTWWSRSSPSAQPPLHTTEIKRRSPLFLSVLRIHDLLAWIRIRMRGSMPLVNGSRSWYFHHWPTRRQRKTNLKKIFFCI